MRENENLSLTISRGQSRKETNWIPEKMTWGQLVQTMRTAKVTHETMDQYTRMTKDEKAEVKDVGGFVGGYVKGNRTAENVQYRQIVSLDIDYPPDDLWDTYGLMCDYECLMHTTHSSTPENPRYRMLFPLLRTVTREEYPAVARMLAKQLGFSMDVYDETAYMVQQLMYWPSVCSDAEYGFWTHEGELASPDALLAMYKDWTDSSEWPRSSKASEDSVRPKTGKRMEDPREKRGLIGAFCRVYDIPEAIAKYLPDIYLPVEGNPARYTYAGGHSTGGLALYGSHDSRFSPPYIYAYSHHDTDPCSGMECNAYDLVRISKFGREGTQDQMKELIDGDEAILNEMTAVLKAEEARMFDDGYDVDNLTRDRKDYTEQGNATKFADRFGDIVCYNGSMGWSVWTGSIWKTSSEPIARKLLMNLNDDMRQTAVARMNLMPPIKKGEEPTPEQTDTKNAYNWWVKNSRSETTVRHVMTICQSLLHKDSDTFDHEPWALNTPSNIIDLRTGEEKPHARTAYCTQCTAVTPNFEMETPEWDAFLERVTGNDHDLIQYLQDVAGMALVGRVYEEALVMVWGPGGNGKSTLFDVWQRVMGDYAGTMRNEVLIGGPNGAEVAGQNQLRGKRLVIMSELEEERLVSSSLIKRLSSRDSINANVKYHEPITFTPSHTLVLHTNHLPRLRGVDGGIMRRIAIVPFNTKIVQSEMRTNMAGYLFEKEGAGILAWMINGAIRFWENDMKLKKPRAVVNATNAYLLGEDKVSRFISECCNTGDPTGSEESSANLFQAFRRWLTENDLRWSGGSISFKKAMQEKGYEYHKTNKGVYVKGIELNDDFM